MSTLPSSGFPSAASCELLSRLKSLTWNILFDLALRFYEGEERTFLQNGIASFLDEACSTPPSHQLAELLYFHYGHRLAATNQLQKLTIAQAQHEILVRGLLTREELTEDIVSLCATILHDNMSVSEKQEPPNNSDSYENRVAQAEPQEESYNAEDMDADVDEEDADEDDSNQDEEDSSQDEEQSCNAAKRWRDNGGYIESYNPKLRRYIRYQF